MIRYTLAHGYTAIRDGRRLGPWAAGEVVELDPADAEWIERDSPGALVEVNQRRQPPTADRQHRTGQNRSR